MPSIDMPLDQLRAYKPQLTRQHDFAAFWKQGLEQVRNQPLGTTFAKRPLPLREIDVYEVSFTGAGGATIGGEMIVPRGLSGAPGVVVYHGYSGRHDAVYSLLHWAAMGTVVFTVDTRGQRGNTVDSAAYPGPRSPGFMTAGVCSPYDYYYRNAYLDCVRALDVLAERDEVDMSRLAVVGMSQGGGLSLATAALDERVNLCLAEVPFLCDFPRAIRITGDWPYSEIINYLRYSDAAEETQILKTLSYFDNINLAGLIRARTLISVGLCDSICPPSGIFGAYNHMACRKEIKVYPHMGHDHNTEFIEFGMHTMAEQFGMK